ncbi:unnamed protein product [Kluyveromyces dobzhanskii CBS 2104]|uniref:WGS project CCBQ000000000 data, contig 00099 n=1 Tax=Kluyveromyces dobzhanskii CBS 2104 TaxID=1427455 RepID=A0A0A8L4S9_9SACH|nr:unnamed protein product [Kluyveromyces dobzhanskii CBS 2104]
MFHHVTIGTNDIVKAKKFYDAVLGVVGISPAEITIYAGGRKKLVYEKDDCLFIVKLPINDEAAAAGNGHTVGFRCASEDEVLKLHDTAVANGGTSVEDAPGLRPTGKFQAYIRDLDGNKLSATFIPSH